MAADGVSATGRSPRSLLGLAHWVSAFLVLCGLGVVLTIDDLAYEVSNLSAAAQGSPVASELQLARGRVHGSSVFAIGSAFLAVVLLLLWLLLAHANLRAFGEAGLRFPPVLAVLGWFVPILDLGLPFLAMRELWKVSDPDAGTTDWRTRRVTPLIPLWWLALLATGILLAMAARTGVSTTAPGVQELLRRDRLLVAASVLSLPTVALTALLVERIAARQAIRTNQTLSGSWSSWPRG